MKKGKLAHKIQLVIDTNILEMLRTKLSFPGYRSIFKHAIIEFENVFHYFILFVSPNHIFKDWSLAK